MSSRYLAAVALTLALAAPALGLARPPHRQTRASVTRRSAAATLDAADLYSRRALRRARIILELKLLELREERLERVRRAIELHVPIDKLLKNDRPKSRHP